MLADTNINTNNTNDRGTHLTQSPWNPVRFTLWMLTAPLALASATRAPVRVASALAAGSDLVGDYDGRYALLVAGAGNSATLITTRRVAKPRSRTPRLIVEVGYPWVLASCASNADLYSIPDRTWQSAPTPSDWCGGEFVLCGDEPVGVGRYWIRWRKTGGYWPVFGDQSYSFQSIADGTVLSDPTNANTLPNVDYASLTQRVCAPLTVPPPYGSVTNGAVNTLTFNGAFAIEQTQSWLASGVGPLRTYLEHCASPMRRTIGSYAVANPTAVIWHAKAGELAGLFLPSLRKFVLRLPAAAASLASAPSGRVDPELTTRTLYVGVYDGYGHEQLWTAASPSFGAG